MNFETLLYGKFKLFGLRLTSVSIFTVLMAVVFTFLVQGTIVPYKIHKVGPAISFYVNRDTTFKITIPSTATLQLRSSNPQELRWIHFTDGAMNGALGEPERQVIRDPWADEPTVYYVQSFPLHGGIKELRGDDGNVMYRLIGDPRDTVDITRSLPFRMQLPLYIIEGMWILGAFWFVFKEHKRLSQ